jgi:hypothetical protein
MVRSFHGLKSMAIKWFVPTELGIWILLIEIFLSPWIEIHGYKMFRSYGTWNLDFVD